MENGCRCLQVFPCKADTYPRLALSNGDRVWHPARQPEKSWWGHLAGVGEAGGISWGVLPVGAYQVPRLGVEKIAHPQLGRLPPQRSAGWRYSPAGMLVKLGKAFPAGGTKEERARPLLGPRGGAGGGRGPRNCRASAAEIYLPLPGMAVVAQNTPRAPPAPPVFWRSQLPHRGPASPSLLDLSEAEPASVCSSLPAAQHSRCQAGVTQTASPLLADVLRSLSPAGCR